MGVQRSGKTGEKSGGSPASVLVVVSGEKLARQIEEGLYRSFIDDVTTSGVIPGAGKEDGWPGSIGRYSAVIAGLDGGDRSRKTVSDGGKRLADRFSDARRIGFEGLLVAILEEGEESEAVRLTTAGADHIVFVPAREIDFEILAEKIRMLKRPGGSDWKMLRDLLRPVEQGVVLLDRDRRIVFANPAAHVAFSTSDDEEAVKVIEDHCTETVFEKSVLDGAAVTYADIAVEGRETHRLLGMEILHLDETGSEECYLVLIHDFSRWKKLDEVRSKFATSLSHRMRTPLTSIRNAVKLLRECDDDSTGEEKEKLIEIGWRNVEKLIANLDELQKIFMIESEELNVCRTMVRLRTEIKSIFEESAEEEKIRDFKLSAADVMVFTGKGRLHDFFTSAIDAYDVWLSEKPFIEISTSVREESDGFGLARRELVVYLRPRTTSTMRGTREGLREFLSLNEAHRGLVLGRLANALDAQLQISPGNTISLTLPLDPGFCREKDLVHPLHMMIERADIMGSPFSLVDLAIQGASAQDPGPRDVLQKVLNKYSGTDLVVALGEETGSWSLFVNDRGAEEIEQLMSSIRRDFLRNCRERDLEIYPSLRWDTRYSRSPGTSASPFDVMLATETV